MQHLFLAFTNPVAGVEATFNNWYDTFHVPEVLRYGRGFTGCRRFKLESEVRHGRLHPWAYLALYDLDHEDLGAVAERPWIQESPPLTPFRGLLENDHVAWVYSPRGVRVTPDSPVSRSDLAASHLLLNWSNALTPTDVHALQATVNKTEGCVAARAYELASAQRRNQLASPWSGLVVFELQNPDARPAGKCQAAWEYVAVSDHVSRTAVLEKQP